MNAVDFNFAQGKVLILDEADLLIDEMKTLINDDVTSSG
jgi:superfamily II DNA/RNA helicase